MYANTIPVYRRFAGLHFDPVGRVIEFIRNCRKKGMDKARTADRMVDQLNYMPTEAELVVNEFWDKAS